MQIVSITVCALDVPKSDRETTPRAIYGQVATFEMRGNVSHNLIT